jgi:hypothetical protein
MKNLLKHTRKLASASCVTDGKSFRLKDFDPGDTLGIESEAKPEASPDLRRSVEDIARLQELLYAQDKWGGCSSSRPWMPRARTAPSSM